MALQNRKRSFDGMESCLNGEQSMFMEASLTPCETPWKRRRAESLKSLSPCRLFTPSTRLTSATRTPFSLDGSFNLETPASLAGCFLPSTARPVRNPASSSKISEAARRLVFSPNEMHPMGSKVSVYPFSEMNYLDGDTAPEEHVHITKRVEDNKVKSAELGAKLDHAQRERTQKEETLEKQMISLRRLERELKDAQAKVDQQMKLIAATREQKNSIDASIQQIQVDVAAANQESLTLNKELEQLNTRISLPSRKRVFAEADQMEVFHAKLATHSRSVCESKSNETAQAILVRAACLGLECCPAFRRFWVEPPKGFTLMEWINKYGPVPMINTHNGRSVSAGEKLADYMGHPTRKYLAEEAEEIAQAAEQVAQTTLNNNDNRDESDSSERAEPADTTTRDMDCGL